MVDHLDTSVLATLQEVMEAEYPVLLDTFLVDSEERLRLLQQACRSGQAENLRQAAHSFKGQLQQHGRSVTGGSLSPVGRSGAARTDR